MFLSFLPWLFLCLGLAVTYVTQDIAQQNAKKALQEEFNFRFDKIIVDIEHRLSSYKAVLRGTAGLFSASQSVDRNGFHKYVSALNLEHRFPGIQGVGYSLLVAPGDKDRHTEQIRSEGFTHYAIHPEGVREIYTSIIYLEPFDVRNQRAFGFDMYAEPTRRAAMAHARDKNRTAVSGKVTLLQEGGGEGGRQAGFLMYVPVYRDGTAHETLAQRRNNLQGWVYAPFRVNDLMMGILGKYFGDVSETLDLEIYDGDTPSAESLMYDTNGTIKFTPRSPHSIFQAARVVNVGERAWTVTVSSLPGFESRLKSFRVRLITAAGIVVSLLLAWVVWLLVNGRSRALQLAEKMNVELIESGKQLRESERYQHALLANLPTAVVVHEPDGAVRYCNEVALQILGLTEEQAIGRMAQERDWHFLNEDGMRMPPGMYPVNRVLTEKKPLHGYVVGLDRGGDQGICWVVLNAYPDLSGDGQLHQVVVSFLDITEQRKAEAALQQSFHEIADLYNHAPCGYHSLDKDGVLLQINDTELAWLGYAREEIVGRKRFSELLSPASARMFHDNYPGFMQRGWVKDLEFEVVRKDGTVFPVLLSATAIRDVEGNFLMSRSSMFDIAERKRAEQALQDSERHTRQLLDGLPVGVVVHNPDGSVRYLNSKARAFFRIGDARPEGGVVANFSWRIVREDGKEMLPEELPERKVLSDGRPLINYVVGVELGEQEAVRWVLLNAFPEYGGGDAISGVIVSFVDITERIQTDAQLRIARAELEHVLNVNPAATYQVRLGSHSTLFRSKAIVEMVGYALEAWEKPGFWLSHIHPDDREQVLMAQNRLLENGTLQHEYRFGHQDGRWVWILDRVNLVCDQSGKPSELVGAWLDITPRKQAEIALENLNRFYSVLSRANEAIVRIAEQDALFEAICRIAVENGRFVMVWIGMVDEAKGDIIPVTFWGHDAGYLDYLQSTGVLGFNGPTSLAIKSGEFSISQDIAADSHMMSWRQEALARGYHSSAAFPLRRDGKVVGAINLYAGRANAFDEDVLQLLNDLSTDISFALGALDQQARRQVAEERLRQLNEELEGRVAERTRQLEASNKELEAFSYSVSHDLRAPLRSIDGFSEILEKRYAERLDDSGKDYLGRVRRASKRMGELIDDLLLLARVTRAELRKEAVDLSRLVQLMAREMQEAAPQRQVEWVIQDGIVAQADSRLIKVVLENLLGNAWKFTARQTAPRIEFGMIEREDEKVIFMRDNGAGFDMHYAGKLFGAFQRLHRADEFEGTGIGLATVQRIIHRHGGRVWAEGKIGHGAAFYFVL